MMERTIIGFDRRIALPWLETSARLAAQALPPAEMRAHLDSLLAEHFPGPGGHGTSRYKMATVLLHIWGEVPPHLAGLRAEALFLLDRTPAERCGPYVLRTTWASSRDSVPEEDQ